MNKYRLVYKLRNGYDGEEILYAVNRTMALEMFEKMEYFNDVIAVDCFRVIDET